MIDTCFAKNPNLLAVLDSSGAKAARCIQRYLATYKHDGETTTANNPQPLMRVKNGFLNQSFPSFSSAWDAAPKRSFKRRENQEIKWQKRQEDPRIWFFIEASLQLHFVFRRTKPCQTTGRAALRRQDTAGRGRCLSPFTYLCQCHQVPILNSI